MLLQNAMVPGTATAHERLPWYYPDATRADAERMLARARFDGIYLVRPSTKSPDSLALSFR